MFHYWSNYCYTEKAEHNSIQFIIYRKPVKKAWNIIQIQNYLCRTHLHNTIYFNGNQ